MTMIEQVARAIAEEFRKANGYSDIKYADYNWQKYYKQAKAAIEAMRVPTDLMLNDMATQALMSDDSYRSVWLAAIEAALKE